MLLELEDVSVRYRKIEAVKGITIGVEEGEIVTLIGANGAGKSTTLRAISGLERLSGGEIRLEGKRIDGTSPEKIAELGIAHVPEGRRVFPMMTVRENLEMGAYLRKDGDALRADFEDVFRRFPRLQERANQLAGTLSGGEQQMLAMGRALMSKPNVILMDEPSLGLSPIMCREIARIIRALHTEKRTIVLVEQNARLALALAQKGYVMETGRIVLEGPAADLRETAAVRAAVEPWGRRSIRWTVKSRRDAAAAAWHAESVVRFCCSTYRGAIAGVRANEDSLIVITADVSGDEPLDARLAILRDAPKDGRGPREKVRLRSFQTWRKWRHPRPGSFCHTSPRPPETFPTSAHPLGPLGPPPVVISSWHAERSRKRLGALDSLNGRHLYR